jgi:glutaredoxin
MSHTEITMYGTAWCSDCRRPKKFFGEQRVHYEFVDIDGNADGLAVVERAHTGKHNIPLLLIGDGT